MGGIAAFAAMFVGRVEAYWRSKRIFITVRDTL
jgi:hypothetical protein